MTGAGVPVVAPRVIVALMPLSSAIVRAADISVKADKHMAEFDGKTTTSSACSHISMRVACWMFTCRRSVAH